MRETEKEAIIRQAKGLGMDEKQTQKLLALKPTPMNAGGYNQTPGTALNMDPWKKPAEESVYTNHRVLRPRACVPPRITSKH